MNNVRVLPIKRQWGYQSIRVVVVLVERGESEDQAWRRHLAANPQDHQADIKIYHVAWPLAES